MKILINNINNKESSSKIKNQSLSSNIVADKININNKTKTR